MLLFHDSFDHYANADKLRKWDVLYTAAGNTDPTINAGSGRRGTQAFRITMTTSPQSSRPMGISLAATGATCVVGMAFSTNGVSANSSNTTNDLSIGGASSNPSAILTIRRNGAGVTTHQVWFRINNDGTITAFRGTTALGTSSTPVSTGSVFQYLEFKVVIDPSAGSIEVRKNGSTILSLSGINTRGDGGGSDWQHLVIGRLGLAASTSTTWDIDDLYVCDGSGSIRNDFLGDCEATAYYPINDGFYTDSTPSSGTARYPLLDETTANGDTDYTTLASSGQKDSFIFPDMAVAGGSILGLQLNDWSRKSDVGTATKRGLIRSGSNDFFSSAKAGTPDYADVRHIFEQNPADSLDFESADLASGVLQYGYEKTT